MFEDTYIPVKNNNSEEAKLQLMPVNQSTKCNLMNEKHKLTNNQLRRMVQKSGKCNVYKSNELCNTRKKYSLYFRDFFTSLIELRWHWMILLFSTVNLVTWYIFGVIWWTVISIHKNLDKEFNESTPCVIGIEDFSSSFLFSVEVQSTLGFGSRVPDPSCIGGLFVLSIQTIFAALFSCVTVGLVFTKASRPTARSKAVIFSKKAIINMQDGIQSLLFQVADIRKSKIINVKIVCYMLEDHRTVEGEQFYRYQRKLDVSVDDAGDHNFILSWPVTVRHKIDSYSPLFHMTPLEILQSNIEIIVSLSGTLELTGQAVEARTSYLASSEILYGYKFIPIIKASSSSYLIDYDQFQSVIQVDTLSSNQFVKHTDLGINN